MDKSLKFTLRRPLTATKYSADSGFVETEVPAGTTITGYLSYRGFLRWDNPAFYAHEIDLMKAAAKIPCPHAGRDWDGDDYTIVEFPVCGRFSGVDTRVEVFQFCRGDMCRCPSSRVRAEAKEEE